MILRGKVYDSVKALGKFIIPVLIAVTPLIQALIEGGDFTPSRIAVSVMGILTTAANVIQTISKRNYTAEQEADNGIPGTITG